MGLLLLLDLGLLGHEAADLALDLVQLNLDLFQDGVDGSLVVDVNLKKKNNT